MKWMLPKADYWNRKLSVYLHDPFTKPFRIPGHEERAQDLLATLGALSFPAKENYQPADQLAAGLDRAQLPGHHEKGSINFSKAPRLTHPTGEEGSLSLNLPANLQNLDSASIELLEKEVLQFLNSKKSIGSQPDEGSLSDQFKGDHDGFAYARFLYVHLQLRNELAKHNVGGLGEFWGRLPADTRQPDHSIWQHNGLVAALSSCRELSESKQASLLVYSLTPVQEFISKARKLRDYWTGSVLLSWLAFAGIRSLIETLGPDHVIYPNLIDQPLVNEYCRQRVSTEKAAQAFFPNNPAINPSVASFPNKFVCLIPTGRETEYTAAIEASIKNSWLGLAHAVKELVKAHTKSLRKEKEYAYVDNMFERQNANYWEHQWAATPLLSRNEDDLIKELLGQGSQVLGDLEFLKDHLCFTEKKFGKLDPQTGQIKQDGRSALYGLSHKLTQSALASIKGSKVDKRPAEPGVKCDLYSEFEIVTCYPGENPNPNSDRFWNELRKNWKSDADFTDSERLCSISLIKRLAYAALEKLPDKDRHSEDRDHYFSDLDEDTCLMLRLLQQTLKDTSFPSTTEMASSDFLDQAQSLKLIHNLKERRALAQFLHREVENNLAIQDSIFEDKEEYHLIQKERRFEKIMRARKLTDGIRELTDADNYYAILLMDGDKMGELVNGTTISAKWKTVLHPDLFTDMQDPGFDKDYRDYWTNKLGWDNKRRLTPALHAAISEALGDFALYGVTSIISKHRGKLIYAGGDDICAIMPVSSVLKAAEEISQLYSAGFVRYHYDAHTNLIRSEKLDSSRSVFPLDLENQKPEKRIVKLAQHLGSGQKLSISAGINICHHKQPLTIAIQRTHKLLDFFAKEQKGRNAIAIELNKRNGGGRVYVSHWSDSEDSTLEAFKFVGEALGKSQSRDLSASLAYRLQSFEMGLLSIIQSTKNQKVCSKMLNKFILQQIQQSGLQVDLPEELAQNVSRLIQTGDSDRLQIEALIVAKFIGERQLARLRQEKL